MGKRKNETQSVLQSKINNKIIKQRKRENKLISFSTSDIGNCTQIRNGQIVENVKKALKRLSKKSKEDNKKRLMSALNIVSQKQIVCSAMNIPSIENMLVSKNQLCSYNNIDQNCSQSGVSFNQIMSYCLLESQPQLMLSYICLVEKALNKLGILLSSQQNQKLIMGVWNILIKFWSDDFEATQYQNLNAKTEWGLLELLNFDLKVSKKQRILMESKLKQLKKLQN